MSVDKCEAFPKNRAEREGAKRDGWKGERGAGDEELDKGLCLCSL